MEIHKSKRLDHLKYEIRGPVYEKALALQNQGYKITSLNIGNPAAFGFETPDEIIHDVIVNIRNAQGYVDSRGLFAARKAVMQYYQNRGVKNILIEDIYIGNGVSELISLVMMALLNADDEILIPSPDYPLWTTVVGLAGGNAVHYSCDENDEWNPDLADIESKITSKTKGIVLINPNNPTGAVYPKHIVDAIVKLAEKHKLILFSDEIYDKIIFDDIRKKVLYTLPDTVTSIIIKGCFNDSVNNLPKNLTDLSKLTFPVPPTPPTTLTVPVELLTLSVFPENVIGIVTLSVESNLR